MGNSVREGGRIMKGVVSMYCIFKVASSLVAVVLFLIGNDIIAGPKLICEEPLYNFGEKEDGGRMAGG